MKLVQRIRCIAGNLLRTGFYAKVSKNYFTTATVLMKYSDYNQSF